MAWSDWWAFQSSHLNAGRYENEEQALQLQFANGAMYHYSGVPQDVVDTFRQTSSPNDYFLSKIKGRYPYVKMIDAQTKRKTKGHKFR